MDVPEAFPFGDLSEHLNDEDALFWVDLCDPDRELLYELASELSGDRQGSEATFGGRAIEEAVTVNGDRRRRPRAVRRASHTFITVYAPRLRIDGPPEPGLRDSRLDATAVFIWVLPRGIVTVRRGEDARNSSTCAASSCPCGRS
jgi:magnesium transporter